MALIFLSCILPVALASFSQDSASLTETHLNKLNSVTICKVPSHKDSILLWTYKLFECLKEDEYDFLYISWINSQKSYLKEITVETRKIWTQYKSKAWGKDSIRTDNGEGLDDIGLCLMIADNIDSLFFLGTRDMYDEAISYLVDHFQLPDKDVPTLQLVKLLGAYLTAYDLSRWPGALEKAKEIGEILLPVFSYKGEKLLNKYVNPVTKITKTQGKLSVGDVTQITEFLKLWRVTSDERYLKLAEDVTNWLYENSKDLKSIPSQISLTGTRRNVLSLSGSIALDESGVATSRNLFNAYLASNQTLPHLKDLYDKQKHYFINSLSLLTSNNLLFIAEQTSENQLDYRMHESACAWPGQLAIDSLIFGYNATEMRLASQLINTCLEMHASTSSSLPPDYAFFKKSGMYFDVKSGSSYKLTSYVVESLLHMWRLTHDINLKKLGYTIYKVLKQKCADQYGYSGVINVHETKVELDRKMPSYFLTRVMKPLYLLFSPNHYAYEGMWIYTSTGNILDNRF